MPVIKPRTRGKHTVRTITRLDAENHETLQAYAAFIQETPDYVLDQLIEVVLSRDKEFLTWRAQQAGPSGAVGPVRSTARSRRSRPRMASADHDGIASHERAGVVAGRDQ